MFNFNEALAEYLELYGELVRYGEQEPRSVQHELENIANWIRKQDVEGLSDALIDLREQVQEIY